LSGLAALLDSNVVIACIAEAHEHHAASLTLLTEFDPKSCAVAAHSFAEAYATLTRTGDRSPFRFTAEQVRSTLESLRAVTTLVGLTPSQTFDTVCRYAGAGGVGSRFYDALIGEAAVMHRIPAIVTWNVRHMGPLFLSVRFSCHSDFSTVTRVKSEVEDGRAAAR
jgi:predicted nucleic acid-binding protein